MSDIRECGTCWWFTRTYNIGEGFCEEHEELVSNDGKACESYMAKGEK